MAQAVTVFRHDDTGAPQLSADRKPSEILAILQACLVDGYGTKTALGWTKEFEDAASFKVAYRNNVTAGGTGGYVQFWSIDGTDGNGKLVNARSALGMTGIDVFVKPSHKTATQATNAGWTGWTLIGTPTAFYFIITTPAGPMGKRRNINENVIFCGDIKPYIPNDASAFIATGTPIQNGDFTPTALGSYNNIFATLWRTQRSFAATQPLLMYGADGTDTGVGYGFITGYHGFDEYTRNRTGQRKGLYNPIVIGAFNTYQYSSSTKS